MYNTHQVKLNVDDATHALIQYQCQAANNLYNAVLYKIRQTYFEQNDEFVVIAGEDDAPRSVRKLKPVKASYAELCSEFKTNPWFKCMTSAMGQQVIKSVVEACNSYNALLKAFFQGQVNRPRIPDYRTSRGLAPIATPARWVKWDLETGDCIFPMGKSVKDDILHELAIDEVRLNGGVNFTIEQVVEIRIVPKLGEFYVEYVYRVDDVIATNLDYSHALGIDHGRDNWLTCVSTQGKSFILDGLKLKSINRQYNQAIAKIKEGKSAKYWDSELDRITTKRNNQMRDAINKTARFLINHCLTNGIGVIVFGWNPGQKDKSAMTAVQNQQFVQIPTGRLKARIQQLCEDYGIQFVEIEEAYTSKASFLDGDSLPRHGEKPSQWKASGKRVKRGMYKSGDGSLINADCNGAANIISKVSIQLSLNLAEVSRAVLSLPKRYCIFSSLKKSYRKRSEAVLQPA